MCHAGSLKILSRKRLTVAPRAPVVSACLRGEKVDCSDELIVLILCWQETGQCESFSFLR
jgi:hypothetical protein